MNRGIKIKPFRNKVCKDEIPVVGNLALTPTQMLKMQEKGIPISSHNFVNEYYDGDFNCSWDVPLDRQRGVDINDMWNHSENVKRGVKNQVRRQYHSVQGYKNTIEKGNE